MQSVLSYIELMLNLMAAETIAAGFLAGLVLFVIGLALVVMFSLSRLLGYRTTGIVAGAVEVTRIKQREREGATVAVTKVSLYPVYEYQASNGRVRQMRASEGGTMVHGYRTGQQVNLIVREDAEYDDVYDADRYGALYVGLGFLASGVGFMIWMGSVASAFGVTLMACLMALSYRVVSALFGGKKVKRAKPRERYSKAFDAAQLKPIEHFARG